MGAIADLWASERGIIAVALILGATILAALKIFTPDQWISYTEWIFVTYAASKTVTGSMTIMKSGVSSGTPAPKSSSATSPETLCPPIKDGSASAGTTGLPMQGKAS